METGTTVYFNGDNIIQPPTPSTLELRAVPGFSDFGEMAAATSGVQTATITPTGSGFVKLVDDRTNADTDWSLSVSASELTSTDNTLTTSNGSIRLDTSGDVRDWIPGPSSSPLHPGTVSPGATAVTVARHTTPATIDLDLAGASEVVASSTAGARQGFAVPINTMMLSVNDAPASFADKTFEGVVTWSLSDTI